jgi:hypothetical protein
LLPQRFELTEADCQWWLERFSKDELVVMAEAIETKLSETVGMIVFVRLSEKGADPLPGALMSRLAVLV